MSDRELDKDLKPSELEIKSDEDWKSRVKAEDAKLDAERQSKSSTGPPPKNEPLHAHDADVAIDASRLPAPQFATLVSMFSTQAMVALGIIPSPIDGQADQQLPLAKHFIDLLGVLEEKTKGNLSEPEQSMLDQSLHELRMAYVELKRAGTT